jgi:adenylate kinase
MPTYVVLLGPPGVGKGTQAELLVERLGLIHVSTGDLFRENINNGTELGKLAQQFISKGQLVPDDVTIAMVRERISCKECQAGAILDGFPRTPAQADALDKMLGEFQSEVDIVPLVTANDDVLLDRLGDRWICRKSGHIYNQKYNPPKKAGVCDLDGSPLYQRDDDKPETVAYRIQVYLAQTAPLIDYYRQRGKLVEINGAQPIDKVFQDMMAALKK